MPLFVCGLFVRLRVAVNALLLGHHVFFFQVANAVLCLFSSVACLSAFVWQSMHLYWLYLAVPNCQEMASELMEETERTWTQERKKEGQGTRPHKS